MVSLWLISCNDNNQQRNITETHSNSYGRASSSLTQVVTSNNNQPVDKEIKNTPTQPKINHYINVDGDRIQSPTYYPKTPNGASAICNDNTYSFSTHRKGTCSSHGGVKKWLNDR